MLYVLGALWLACAILVLAVNLPPGIRHAREFVAMAKEEDLGYQPLRFWGSLIGMAVATALVFAPITAIGILLKGGSTFGDHE